MVIKQNNELNNKEKKKEVNNITNINNNKLFDEYNLNSKIDGKTITMHSIHHLLIGLENLDNSSYMNATLQCFCNIEKFIYFFKYNKNLIEFVRNDITSGNKTLTSTLKLIIEKLLSDKSNQFYDPKEIKNKIASLGHVSTEPKDLLIFFISTLHKELNKAPMKFINKNINLDKRNKQLMFQLFTEDFINSNRSIISDLFY